jgi:mono/diheme cytochrome c family protein
VQGSKNLSVLVVVFGFTMAITKAATRLSFPARGESPSTFTKDVAPIIFAHCAGCHRPGQVAPFSLLSYADARAHGSLIAAVTKSRFMPPWKPEPNFGDFAGSRRLSEEEIETFQKWVAEGMPQGDPRDLPPPPQFADTWYLGKPDLVVSLRQPFDVPAGPNDLYRCFVIPLHLPEDRYISAYEFRPGNARVVHHAIIVEDSYGAAQRLQGSTASGYDCFGSFGFPVPGYLGLWTSGTTPRPWPAGVATRIRKGAGLVVQVHFHPDGKPEKEQFEVGLYFAKEPAEKVPFDVTVGTEFLNILPGDPAYRVNSYAYTLEDGELLGVIPHAHLLGKEVKATATLPDGTVQPLIWIKHWDFNWQEEYRYRHPVFLPQGTRIDVQWTYDNSAENPRNPNHPPKLVTWGEQSTDEMCEFHLEMVKASPAKAGK